VVQGSGPVGVNAAVFAALSGAARVLMIGAPAPRLATAREMGVDETLDLADMPSPADRIDWVRARTSGRGADVVIEATGNPQAVPEGLEMVRDAGRYVIVGQYTDAGDTTINPHRHLNRRHATVLGCWGYEFTHFHRAIALLARHDARLGWRRLVSREYPLDGAGDALGAMAALQVVKAVIRPSRGIPLAPGLPIRGNRDRTLAVIAGERSPAAAPWRSVFAAQAKARVGPKEMRS
jgi:L-iditol 2-dehydrogenase